MCNWAKPFALHSFFLQQKNWFGWQNPTGGSSLGASHSRLTQNEPADILHKNLWLWLFPSWKHFIHRCKIKNVIETFRTRSEIATLLKIQGVLVFTAFFSTSHWYYEELLAILLLISNYCPVALSLAASCIQTWCTETLLEPRS